MMRVPQLDLAGRRASSSLHITQLSQCLHVVGGGAARSLISAHETLISFLRVSPLQSRFLSKALCHNAVTFKHTGFQHIDLGENMNIQPIVRQSRIMI